MRHAVSLLAIAFGAAGIALAVAADGRRGEARAACEASGGVHIRVGVCIDAPVIEADG